MHPLDPLSADEITQAVAIVRLERDLAPTFRFASVPLEEPANAWLAAWDGTTVERLARIVTSFDRNPALDVPPEKERCHGQHAH
jgi:primary-amine oxidase